MRPVRHETLEQRVFGMTRPGHEGRIQMLEKAAAAAGANLAWGFLKATLVTLASSTTLTNIDFVVGGNNSGDTSGDDDITIGDVGSGRIGLLLNNIGVYLVGYSVAADITGAAAAGSVIQFSSPQGLSNDVVAGSLIGPWLALLGSSNAHAETGLLQIENHSNAGLLPRKISLQVGQNSGATTTNLRCEIFALKISSTASANFT